MKFENILDEFRLLTEDSFDSDKAVKALRLIGINGYDAEDLAEYKLWSDYLPVSDIDPYTESQRNLHILWESIDMVPLSLNIAFAVPFRQIIAKRLFKKCGKGFVTNSHCRFNFGHRLEVGDNVAWNSGVYIDTKGGVELGDYVFIAEDVRILTHKHAEDNHMQRTYQKVIIKPYASLYTGAMVLAGNTIGTGSIVAAKAIVTHDIPDYVMAGGVPAKEIRKRIIPEGGIENCNHYALKNRMFQDE